MAMARGFKLVHALSLVFVWQYCVKVDAFFTDITGFFNSNTFGSGGVGVLNNRYNPFAPNGRMMSPPQSASGIAPVGLETPLHEVRKASLLGRKLSEKTKIGVASNDKTIHLKSGGNIALSHGGIISRKVKRGGKIGFKSSGNTVVSHGLETSMSNMNKALSSGEEIQKRLQNLKRKVNVGVSHGGKKNKQR